MGCAPSQSRPSSGVQMTPTMQVVAAPQRNTPPRDLQTSILPVTSGISATAAEKPVAFLQSPDGYRILVSYHVDDSEIALDLKNFIAQQTYAVSVMSIDQRGSTRYRDALARWTDILVVVVSYAYQKHPICVELANYLKDQLKPVVAVVLGQDYEPAGSMGALTKSYGEFVRWQPEPAHAKRKLVNLIQQKLPTTRSTAPAANETELLEANGQTTKISGQGVYIAYVKSDQRCVDLVTNGKGYYFTVPHEVVKDNGASKMSDYLLKLGSQTDLDENAIKNCKVFLPILSRAFEQSDLHHRQYEIARVSEKAIIPVKAEKFKPAGWLGLATAAKLYYEIIDEEALYKKYPTGEDSTPMNDFLIAVRAGLQDSTNEIERERILTETLRAEVDALKKQLASWPPAHHELAANQNVQPMPSKVDLLPKDALTAPLNHIEYQVFRMGGHDAKPLYDAEGKPQKYDCMLSYRWNVQSYTRVLWNQLNMKNLRPWMDIMGGMINNINEAMAVGIENCTVVVVILNTGYQTSINCNLELKYALALNKPIIFILQEPQMQVADWIKPHLDHYLCIEMPSTQSFGETQMGYPKINLLSTAIQKYIAWKITQPWELPKYISEECRHLFFLIEDAKYALAEQTGNKRFSTCTRCGAQYDQLTENGLNATKNGCKKHRAYFVGGTIIAGRWVCCQNTDKQSPGCTTADHIDVPRSFGPIEGYPDCLQWTPA